MMPLGYKHSEETRQKIMESLRGRGIGKWNIGRKASEETKRKMSLAKKGRSFTEVHKKRIAESKRGEKHPLWKGSSVGYKSLHQWVVRRLGKPIQCSRCKSEHNVEWANMSHEYKRDLEDWLQLCKKCHWLYDQEKWGLASEMFISSTGGLGERI